MMYQAIRKSDSHSWTRPSFRTSTKKIYPRRRGDAVASGADAPCQATAGVTRASVAGRIDANQRDDEEKNVADERAPRDFERR